jgi:hypothetical protein
MQTQFLPEPRVFRKTNSKIGRNISVTPQTSTWRAARCRVGRGGECEKVQGTLGAGAEGLTDSNRIGGGREDKLEKKYEE